MTRRQMIPTILAVLMLVGSGYVHGIWTGRWQQGDPASEAAKRLDRFPMVIGDWEATTGEISEAEQKLAGLSGYLLRHFRHRHSGNQVTVLLMCGASGPVAVHPPTACYSGAGYQQIGVQEKHFLTITAPDDSTVRHVFETAEFSLPRQFSPTHPRIYWAWTTNGAWQVPENPRLTFGGAPVLFKLYITWETSGTLQSDQASPPETFLPLLIPALSDSVFAASLPGIHPET